MLYMIVEKFREGQAEAIYRRFADKGRMQPDGLEYVDSWISENLQQCFQLMRCDDARLLDTWMNEWNDLIEFEVIPVISSRDAAAKALGNQP